MILDIIYLDFLRVKMTQACQICISLNWENLLNFDMILYQHE